jgi:hypothetical protein
VIADRAAQRGQALFEGVEHRALCHRALHLEDDLAFDVRQRVQVRGQDDAVLYQNSIYRKAPRSWLIAWTVWMTFDPDRAAFRHYDVR